MNHLSDSHTLDTSRRWRVRAAGILASAVAPASSRRASSTSRSSRRRRPVPAAAVFTTNKVAAAPVLVSRRHIARGAARAVVINAGNANACTGAQGIAAAETTAPRLAGLLGCEPHEVVVSSTGVIGVPLPVDKLLAAAVPRRSLRLSAAGGPMPRRPS